MQLRVEILVCAVFVMVQVSAVQASAMVRDRRVARYERQCAHVQAQLERLRALRSAAQSKKCMTPEQKASFDERIMEKITWERKRLEYLNKLKRSEEQYGVPCAVHHEDFICLEDIACESYHVGWGYRVLYSEDEDSWRDIDGSRERKRARYEAEQRDKKLRIIAFILSALMPGLQQMEEQRRNAGQGG